MICSPTPRASRAPQRGWPTSIRMGGRIAPDWVADFRQNGWPDCVGISGRLGPDYASQRGMESRAVGHFRHVHALHLRMGQRPLDTLAQSLLSGQRASGSFAQTRQRRAAQFAATHTAFDLTLQWLMVGAGRKDTDSGRIQWVGLVPLKEVSTTYMRLPEFNATMQTRDFGNERCLGASADR